MLLNHSFQVRNVFNVSSNHRSLKLRNTHVEAASLNRLKFYLLLTHILFVLDLQKSNGKQQYKCISVMGL